VLYHSPCYVSYHPSIALVHAQGIAVPTYAKDNFALTAEALRAAWEPGCKILMLNLPCNPTGGTCTRDQLSEIAEFAREKDLLVFSDEIYSELTFEGQHTSIASLPGMAERTVFLHGFSKAFAMTGWRIGTHGWDSVQAMREQYHRRRDLLVRRFNEMGLKCHSPRGSFYTFPDITATGLDERTFAAELLKQEKVAVVPGTAFGEGGRGHVRACFATAYDQIIEACDRMERFVAAQLGKSDTGNR